MSTHKLINNQSAINHSLSVHFKSTTHAEKHIYHARAVCIKYHISYVNHMHVHYLYIADVKYTHSLLTTTSTTMTRKHQIYIVYWVQKTLGSMEIS